MTVKTHFLFFEVDFMDDFLTVPWEKCIYLYIPHWSEAEGAILMAQSFSNIHYPDKE